MKIAALRRPDALRIGENDGSSSSGWTNHTTSTWSLTFDLQNHRWHIDVPLQEVSHDETDRKTDRKDHVPSKIKLWQKPELWLAEGEGRSSSMMTLKQMPLVTQTHLFMCRIVRLPVLVLLMTMEAGRKHWGCSDSRDTSMQYFWKSSKIKLQTGNCLHWLGFLKHRSSTWQTEKLKSEVVTSMLVMHFLTGC